MKSKRLKIQNIPAKDDVSFNSVNDPNPALVQESGRIAQVELSQGSILLSTDRSVKSFNKNAQNIVREYFSTDLRKGLQLSELLTKHFHPNVTAAFEWALNGESTQITLQISQESLIPIELILTFIPLLDETHEVDLITLNIFPPLHSESFVVVNQSANLQITENKIEGPNDLLSHFSRSAIFLMKTDGTILEANQAASELFGFSLDEFKQIGRQGILEHNDPELPNILEERERTGRTIGKLTALHKNGIRFPVEFSSVLYTSPSGEEFAFTMIQDFSRSQQSEQEMSLLINNTEEGFVLLDMDFKIVSFNNQTKKWYSKFRGLEIKKGESILNYALQEDSSKLQTTLERVIKGEYEQKEITIPTINNNYKSFKFKYSPARDSDEKIIGVFLTATDITDKKFAEDRLNIINNNLPGAILQYQLNEDGTDQILYLSSGSKWLWGMDAEDAIQNNQLFWDLFLPEDLSAMRASLKRSAATLEKWTSEWRILNDDGTVHWQRGIGTPQKMLDGSIIWDALVINITPEKSAEEFLITKEKRYRALVENGADAVVIVDLAGKPKYVSPSIERVLGYTEAESIMLDLFEILHPEDREATAKRMAASLDNPGVPIPGHTGRIKHKDGSWRWVEATLTNMLHDPNINGIVDNFRDVTERIQYEEILRQLNNKFELLLQSTFEGLYGINLEGECIFMNNAAAIMLGYEARDCIGKNMHDLIHHTKRDGSPYPAEECPLFAANINAVRTTVTDEVFWKSDGSPLEISYSTNPIQEGDGFKGSVVTFMDISLSKKSAEELKKSKESLQKILDQSVDIICTINGEGKFEQVSAASTKIWGYTPEELTGRLYIELVHPQDVELTNRIAAEIVSGMDITNFENRYIRKDGSIVPIIWSARWDDDSRLMYCIAKDATQTKQSEFEMKMLINNTEESFVLTDKKLNILSFNAQFDKLFRNYFGQQVNVGENIVTYAQPERVETVREIYKKVLNGESVHSEIQVVSPEGNHIDVSLNYKPALNEQNEIIGAFVTCVDITEKKKYIAKLKEDEEKLQTAQKIAQLGYWQISLVDFSLYWSDELYNIWGVDKESYTPSYENLMETVHPDDRHFFDQQQEPSYEHGNEFEHRIILPDGSIKWIHERGKYKLDKDGKPLIFEGTAQDITESHLAKEKLLMSEARHRGLIESQTNYVIRTDLEGNYTFCNEKFREDFGWIHGTDVLYGQNGLDSIVEYHHDRVRETVEKCFVHLNQVFQVELDKPKSNGSIVTTIWDFICLTDSKGQATEIQCVGIDISARKIAEDALLESNKRYEYVSRATFDAIWDWDVKSDKIIWGEGFYTIFGYQTSGSDVEISSWFSRIHPADLDRILASIKNAMDGISENWEDEYRYKKADGTYSHVLDRAIILRDSDGKSYRLVGAMQDVSEKKKLQELLEKSNNLARIGSWEAEIQKGTTYLSPITRSIYEIGDDTEYDFAGLLQFYKEGFSREKLRDEGTAAVMTGTPFDLELIVVTAKGNELWVRLLGNVEFENGIPTKLFGSIQDIDATKKAQIAALEAYNEKNQILESIDDAFIALDKNWIVTYWNKEAEKLLGKLKDEMIGQNIWDVYADAVESDFYKHYTEAIADGKPHHFEAFYAGVDKWLEVSAFPSSSGLSIYFKNITERKFTEVQLTELNEKLLKQAKDLSISNSELEQFAYVASHDLQEPLRMVTGFLSQLEKKYNDKLDDTGKKYIHFAVDGARRMRQIILDLLEYSRVGRMEDSLEDISVEEVVKEILILHQVQINELNASIQFDNLPTIKSYKTPLRQVFQNLISNALKYHSKERSPLIRISCVDRGKHWEFSVSDNGIGIEPEYFERIFIIFQRLHDRSQYSGTGIGLAITRKIIENLGGNISVESEEDKGSVFTFTILKQL